MTQLDKYGIILERTIFDANEFTINDNDLEIVLYNNRNIEVARAITDAKYFDIVKNIKWKLDSGYVKGRNKNGGIVRLHRLILNAPKGKVVDHIDHNTLNCRERNLRICTRQENCCNQKPHKRNTSGYKGVSWNKEHQKWIAKITVKRKQINIGSFKNIEDAIVARKAAEEKYFGEFAYKEVQ